jgi:FKBP-type peptidyl-prolyl cis-trans isomerase (trigger factor)
VKHELTDAQDGRKSLRITAEWPEVAADYHDVLAEYGTQAVPGFRPGRAPQAVVEQRFRRQLRDDFTARCGRRLAREALREHNLRAAGPINVVEIAFEPRREFAFTAECVPTPRLELPDYTAASLTGTTDDERRDALSEWLLAHTAWDVPEPLIRGECARSDSSGSEPGSDAWLAAAQRVKLMLILDQIAEAEGIEADERDVEARIGKMAGESSVKAAELRRQLGADGVSRLQSLLRAEQTLAYLIENTKRTTGGDTRRQDLNRNVGRPTDEYRRRP